MDKFQLLCAIFVFTACVQVSNSFLAIDQTIKNPLIVGGVPAHTGQFPHSVALLNSGSFFCGGSIISRLWVLTAAHCLSSSMPLVSNLQIIGGSISRTCNVTTFSVAAYAFHPLYRRGSLNNDVAVIRAHTSTPLEGHEHIQPISLPNACFSKCCKACSNTSTQVAGWGRVDGGLLPDELHFVYKLLMSNITCATKWVSPPITPGMLCTYVIDGRDSCHGDSGSALILKDCTNEVDIQVGIVSFGSSICGDGSRPAVYVNVEYPVIRNWIKEITGI